MSEVRRKIPNWEDMFEGLKTAFPEEIIESLNDTVATFSDESLQLFANAKVRNE